MSSSKHTIFRQTLSEFREITEWLLLHARNHNCGCEELIGSDGSIYPQPFYHDCNYINTRNKHIHDAVLMSTDRIGFNPSKFSNEMDRFGRTLL